MSKLYAAALILGAIAGPALLTSVGCTSSAREEETGTVYGAAGESDAADAGIVRGTLIISAVYPFGGRTGAKYKNDYVEILNKTNRELPLDGLTLQLAKSPTGAFNTPVLLEGKIGPGQYFLVALGSGGAQGDDLPAPDQTVTDAPQIGGADTTGVRAAGKVALALGATPLNCGGLGSACAQTRLLDLVGWGSTNSFEGAGSAPPFPEDAAEAEKRAMARPGNSCGDTDNNAKDIASAEPNPRNAETNAVNCNPPKPDAGVDANSIPKIPEEPELGEESPFDGGVRPDSGRGTVAAPAAEEDCAVGSVGAGGFGVFTPVAGLALAAIFVARRRRRENKS